MKYLIVEDTEMYREVAEKVVKEAGREVVFATNYEEAKVLLETATFDAVITDLFFPESNNEKIGKVGEKMMEYFQMTFENLPQDHWAKNDSKTSKSLELAPMGMQIIGLVFSKNIPLIIASHGDRHYGDLGYVRNVVNCIYHSERPADAINFDFANDLLAKGGFFEKDDQNCWKEWGLCGLDEWPYATILRLKPRIPFMSCKTLKILFGIGGD